MNLLNKIKSKNLGLHQLSKKLKKIWSIIKEKDQSILTDEPDKIIEPAIKQKKQGKATFFYGQTQAQKELKEFLDGLPEEARLMSQGKTKND